jgi:heat shock protein HslJ
MPAVARRTVPALILATLTACAAAPAGTGAVPLEGTTWLLAGLPGRALVPESTVTLLLADGRAGGTDGCNRYGAAYTLPGGSRLDIDAAGAASTMMACPAALMEQASAFMAGLARTHGYRLTADRLELLAADGAVLALLTRQAASLAGTAWRVTGYNNGRQAVVSVLAGTSLTLVLGPDGRAGGSAGCNGFTASWSGSGGQLKFGPPAATRRYCDTPAGVMEQEQQFLQALASAASARREGGRLELRAADGTLAVSLVKDPAA